MSNLDTKVISLIPTLLSPAIENIKTNISNPVSISPSVEEVHRNNVNPIIVVPGVMGSKLYPAHTPIFPISVAGYETGAVVGTPIWLGVDVNAPVAPHITLWKLAIKNEVVVCPPSPFEYGVLNIYKKLVDELIKKFPNRKIYFYSYDWRQSNDHTALLLKEFIASLQSNKVDLVCHSMGGLVASTLSNLTGMKEKLDNIITLGTPYEGSPNLLRAILTAHVMDLGTATIPASFFIWLSGMKKYIKLHLPGVTELAPTKAYVRTVPQSHAFDEYQINNKESHRNNYDFPKRINYENLTVDEYHQICSEIFKSDPSYDDILSFQNSISEGILSFSNSYFGIAGNKKTLRSLTLRLSTSNDIDHEVFSTEIICEDATFETQGDGTVPFLSANKMNRLSPSNLGNQRVKHFYNTTHTKVVKEDDTILWVSEILKNGTSELGKNEPPKGDSHIDVRVACPVDVTISNGAEALSSNATNLNPSTDFGEMVFLGREGEIKLACLNMDNHTIQLQGTDTGTMDYSLRHFGADNAVVQTRDFCDIPVNKDTLIITDTNMDEPTVLTDKTTFKYQTKTYEPQITKHYHATSIKTPQVDVEYKEFTADDAVDLYNRAEIIDDTKTIDLSEYAYLPFDVARAWLIFAENDGIELNIKSEQSVLDENGEEEAFSQITFILGKELRGDIALTHAFYLTQSERQYI